MIKRGLRRSKEPETSRAEFLRAAFELFCEKGYHETSVEDIVTRSHRSKGGFYHHFGSKSELFREMFDGLIRRMVLPLEQAMRDGLSLRELFEQLPAAQDETLGNPLFLKAVVELYLLAVRNDDVRQMVRHFNKIGIDLVETLLEQADTRGEIRPLGDRAGEMAEMIHHGSRGILIMEVILNNGKDIIPKIIRYMDHEFQILGQ
jgi:AcrR family transcriptional regulator